MTSLGKSVICVRARTALGARKSFSVLAVTAVAAAGLTAVAGAGIAGAAATHAGRHHHAAPVAPGSGPSNDETTVSQNNLRNGWDPNEPALTRPPVPRVSRPPGWATDLTKIPTCRYTIALELLYVKFYMVTG